MDEPHDESLVNVDRAFQVAWIVYINGIECPAMSTSIAYGVWQIPECEITLIPDPVLQRLGAEDRVSVQVFYCDYWQRPDEPTFRLMFDGEIVAWNYVNVQRGRALSFTCIDYIQIFTQLFFFFMSNVDDIATGVSAEECGVGISTVSTPGFGALYPYSLFAEGLVSVEGGGDLGEQLNDASLQGKTGTGMGAPVIKRPIDFVYNVVRGLIQLNAPNRSVPATNFFAPWTRRTNFHRRFIALPLLERSRDTDAGLFPILRAVQEEGAVSAVARLASSIGSSGSIWDMLQQVLMTMMMEINMLPTPSCVRIDSYPAANYRGLEVNGPPSIVDGYPAPSLGLQPLVLTNYMVKPQFLFGVPPSCNVFYPSQVVHFAYEENYSTQPTRMYFNEESWTSYLNTAATVGTGLRSLMRDALAVAHPEEVHLAARAAVGNPGENNKNILVYPEEFFKGPVVDRRPMPRWFTFLENAAEAGRDGPPNTSTTEHGTTRSTSTRRGPADNRPLPASLRAQLAAPPSSRDRQLAARAGIPHDVLRAIRQTESGDDPGVSAFNAHIFHRNTNPAGTPLPAAYASLPREARRQRTREFRRTHGVYFGNNAMPQGFGRINTDRARRLPTLGGVSAAQINRAAIDATAWGRYQVLGTHLRHQFRRWGRRTDDGAGHSLSPRGDAVAWFDANADVVSELIFVRWFQVFERGRTAARRRDFQRLMEVYYGSPTARWAGRTARFHAAPIPLDPAYPAVGARAGVPDTATVPPAAEPEPVDASAAEGNTETPAAETNVQPEVAPGDDDRNVYRKYAQYEYFKERYARRTGGVQLVFNPYPAPGFPCAIFDRRSTQMDVFGYVMNVRQNMHSKGWATQLSFSYGRTFREAFALLNRQFTMENTTIEQQRAETQRAVAEGTQERLDEIGTRVGAIVVAPPEPIGEIRRVIQNFDAAEGFYRSLFYRTAAPFSDALDQAQIRADADRRDASVVDPTDPNAPPAVAPTQAVRPPTQSARIGLSSVDDLEVARDLQGRTAAFLYNEIIEYENLQGERVPIQLEGIDSAARNRALNVIGLMRSGTANEEDLAFIRDSFNAPDLQQQQTPQAADTSELTALKTLARNTLRILGPTDATTIQAFQNVAAAEAALEEANEEANTTADSDSLAITERLNTLEVRIRLTGVTSNVTGDRNIVPKREALHLFNSYESAMRNAARPICTLDEYVAFLGEDGIREGEITPATALLQGDSRTFPATYYIRIRAYRAGPPDVIPTADITNTDIITNIDGIEGTALQSRAREDGSNAADDTAAGRIVQGLPTDFPQNRANWTAVLLEYRINALITLAPRT